MCPMQCIALDRLNESVTEDCVNSVWKNTPIEFLLRDAMLARY